MPNVFDTYGRRLPPADLDQCAFGGYSSIAECCGSGLAQDVRHAIGSDYGNKGIVLSINDFPVEPQMHDDYIVENVKIGEHYFNILLNQRSAALEDEDGH